MNRLLRIDDNGHDLDAMVEILRTHGYSVDAVIDEPPDAKEALRQSENRYRGIFENAPVGIFRSTLEGKFISVNPAVARMLKYDSPEEMIRLVNRTTIADALFADPSCGQEIRRSALRGNGWLICEERFRCKDGGIITCNLRYRAVPGQGDSSRELEGFVEDITQRKLTEEELRRSNEVLRAVIEAAPTAIIGLDLEGNVCHVWNPAAEKLLGWAAGEVMGRPLPSVPEESREEFRRFREWIHSGKSMDGVEVRRQRRDGTPVDYSIYASPLRDGEGRIIGNIAVLVDIGERKRIEEALSQSENRYRLIVETADEGIWQVDREWRTTYVNRRMELMLGCEPGEMLGLHIFDFMDTEGRREAQELMSHRENGARETHDFRFYSRDGSYLDTLASTSPVFDDSGGFAGAIAMVSDITERKRAEEALKLSQFIIDKASIGIFRGQADAKILFANEFGAGMLGYTPEELSAMSFFDIDPSLTPETWLEHRQKLTAIGFNTFESMHRRKDGSLFPVEVTVNYLKYGDQVFSCSFSQDITRRKEAAAALRKSEEKFRILAETSAAAIILYQGEKIVYVNPATARMFGYTEGELLEMRFWDCIHPEFKEIARFRGLARQRGETVPNQYEIKLVIKGGQVRWAIVSAGKIEYKGEPACIVTMIDITETKRSEELISASLAEKELLLREVHHRVKNNLQIISTLLDLQSESIQDTSALNSFRESQDRIKAMALIHERLYESEDFSSVDFAEYIGSLSAYLFDSYLVDPGRIVLKIDAGGVSIGIDRAIPCGLIINELVSNALKHAFPGNRAGEISIRFDVDADDWITLTVADSGVGIPPDLDLENTGTLGLQLVNMLARQLGGVLSAGNMGGAVFSIRFCRNRPA